MRFGVLVLLISFATTPASGQTCDTDCPVLLDRTVRALADHWSLDPRQVVLDTVHSGFVGTSQASPDRERLITVAMIRQVAERVGFQLSNTEESWVCRPVEVEWTNRWCDLVGGRAYIVVGAPTSTGSQATMYVARVSSGGSEYWVVEFSRTASGHWQVANVAKVGQS